MSKLTIPPELLPYLLHQKVDLSSQSKSIVTVNAVFLALIWVTTGLRFWVRFRMLGSAGLDDILIIVALFFATCISISSFVGESFGLGKHIWNLSTDSAEILKIVAEVTKSLFGAYLSYSTAIAFTKFSIMATYIRIFPHGILRKTVYGTGIIVLCFWISSIFAITFTCIPVQASWNFTIVNAKCFPIVNFFYASSAFNIVTNILLCVLPIQTLWALQLPKAQRLVLIILFSMGTFACVASVIRLTRLKDLGSGVDETYATVGSLNWSVIEVDTGIVCASLSALRPLARKLVPGVFSGHLDAPHSRIPSPIEKPLVESSPTRTNTANSSVFESRFQPPPSKILSFNAIVSGPTEKAPARAKRSRSVSSIATSKSEIYVQRTFEVQSVHTMKDLPDLPDPLRSHAQNAQARHIGELADLRNAMSTTALPRTTSPIRQKSPVRANSLVQTELSQIQRPPTPLMPQRMSSIGKGGQRPKPKLEKIDTRTAKEIEEKEMLDAESGVLSPDFNLKWPLRTLTKEKHERKNSKSRPSVVGMFTADLLDFTSSSEDEGRVSGESTGSEDTIRR